LDNHVKAWFDVLADAIGIDDRHITDLHARWRADGEPGVYICVFHDGTPSPRHGQHRMNRPRGELFRYPVNHNGPPWGARHIDAAPVWECKQ
jgi:hypothetical protein